jgi:hypothetical protein
LSALPGALRRSDSPQLREQFAELVDRLLFDFDEQRLGIGCKQNRARSLSSILSHCAAVRTLRDQLLVLFDRRGRVLLLDVVRLLEDGLFSLRTNRAGK